MKDEATEHEFIGFDPDQNSKTDIGRYFKLLKKEGIKLSHKEKKKIKENIFKEL